MKANTRAIMRDDVGAFDTRDVIGILVVVVVFGSVVTLAAGNLNTAAANASVIALGINGFMAVVAIVFVAAVIIGITQWYRTNGG